MENKHDYSKMALTPFDAVLIFVYYGILIITSISMLSGFLPAVLSFDDVNSDNIAQAIVTPSALGAAIFYSRKLYKASIGGLYSFEKNSPKLNQRIGTIAFYVFRPFFGVSFAIVLYCAWKASLYVSIKQGADVRELVALIIPSSFLCGFSAGRIIEKFLEKETSFVAGAGIRPNE